MEYFIERGHKFFHFYELKIITISNNRRMTYELYNEQPTQMIELKINMIIDNIPHLMNALERSANYLLIRKCSNLSFN